MLELGSSGSVRGVSSNGHPYRDPGSRAAVPSAGAHSRCTLYCGRTVILPKASRRCQHRTIEVHQDDLAPLLRMRAEEG